MIVSRSLLLLFALPVLLARPYAPRLAIGARGDSDELARRLNRYYDARPLARQANSAPKPDPTVVAPTTKAPEPPVTAAPQPTTTPEKPTVAPTTAAPPPTQQQPATQPAATTPATTPDNKPPTATTPAQQPSSPTTAPPSNNPPKNSPPPTHTTSLSTDAQGVTVVVTVPYSASSTSTSATPTSTQPASSGGGASNSTIIGLSVSGGLALIGLAGFIFWKVRSKRDEFDDDAEAIKWPELNDSSAMQPLPSRAGTRNGGGDASTLGASDMESRGGFDRTSIAGTSTADLHPVEFAQHPYSQPGPQVSQAYFDESGQPAGYYDPYRGPLPQTFAGQDPHAWGGAGAGLAAAGYGRSLSPAPSAAGGVPGYGRSMSPAPMGAVGRTPSPGPNMAYGARTQSPAPQLAYGNDIQRYGSAMAR
ncbi:hypothetical protein BOTBODRAFT_44435 [Botryobasidium botryosum FD-172 SS1]|uniref:Mid2 domain-containing protein n=1 Tax=Botryobasidium botryosum (strain FD-172 SS1) TaxID=930990 RepID=A0A067MHF1_BOTB1|nr:hypothetical protein BOTBODRAFT_44435 [Botryobasidium botryosum FD-172 SS1]